MDDAVDVCLESCSEECCGKEPKRVSEPIPKCCKLGPSDVKFCMYSPNGETGKCFAPAPTKLPINEYKDTFFAQSICTGGEKTLLGVAGGGKTIAGAEEHQISFEDSSSVVSEASEDDLPYTYDENIPSGDSKKSCKIKKKAAASKVNSFKDKSPDIKDKSRDSKRISPPTSKNKKSLKYKSRDTKKKKFAPTSDENSCKDEDCCKDKSGDTGMLGAFEAENSCKDEDCCKDKSCDTKKNVASKAENSCKDEDCCKEKSCDTKKNVSSEAENSCKDEDCCKDKSRDTKMKIPALSKDAKDKSRKPKKKIIKDVSISKNSCNIKEKVASSADENSCKDEDCCKDKSRDTKMGLNATSSADENSCKDEDCCKDKSCEKRKAASDNENSCKDEDCCKDKSCDTKMNVASEAENSCKDEDCCKDKSCDTKMNVASEAENSCKDEDCCKEKSCDTKMKVLKATSSEDENSCKDDDCCKDEDCCKDNSRDNKKKTTSSSDNENSCKDEDCCKDKSCGTKKKVASSSDNENSCKDEDCCKDKSCGTKKKVVSRDTKKMKDKSCGTKMKATSSSDNKNSCKDEDCCKDKSRNNKKKKAASDNENSCKDDDCCKDESRDNKMKVLKATSSEDENSCKDDDCCKDEDCCKENSRDNKKKTKSSSDNENSCKGEDCCKDKFHDKKKAASDNENSCKDGDCCKDKSCGTKKKVVSRDAKKKATSSYDNEISCKKDCCKDKSRDKKKTTSSSDNENSCKDEDCCKDKSRNKKKKVASFFDNENSCKDGDCCKDKSCDTKMRVLQVTSSEDENSCKDEDCCKDKSRDNKMKILKATSSEDENSCKDECCKDDGKEKLAKLDVLPENSDILKKCTISVIGMDCTGCITTLESHLSQLPGVHNVVASLLTATSIIDYNPEIVAPDDIVKHINQLGTLTGSLIPDASTFIVDLKSMDANCEEVISAIQNQPGVVSVEPVADKLLKDKELDGPAFSVFYNPRIVGVRDLQEKLCEQFPDADPTIARPDIRNVTKDRDREKFLRIRFWVSLILCIPIIISAFILPDATEGAYTSITVGGLPIKFIIEWLFTTPIQLYLAIPIYKSAWSAARYTRQANMDTLIALSTSVAYFYSTIVSVVILILGGQGDTDILHDIFFETSAIVIVLILLGRYLEMLAKRQTSSAVTQLLQLQPDSALLAEKDVEIPAYLLQFGDILKVVPGSKIPTDGVVVSGTSFVDESMLTGESLPVKKKKNSVVYAGTVNTDGMITMKVMKIPGENELNNIANQLEKTQMSKAKIERITDTIASRFVLFVVSVAIVVFFIWLALGLLNVVHLDSSVVPFALKFALAVLIVSCPCAIGLAVPTAVMVGSGVAAKRHHLLFKGGDTLETCAKINTVCFDKTGTLTEGKLSVVEINLHKSTKEVKSKQDVLFYAASAELGSEHPIGRAIVGYQKNKKKGNSRKISQPKKAIIVPGKGIEATLKNGVKVHVGTSSFLLDKLGIKISNKINQSAAILRESGATVVFVAVEETLVGSIAVSDVIKPSSKAVVEKLKEQHINVWMITGDHKSTAAYIAKQLGINNVVAEALPADKARVIADLQNKGMCVAMLGDGVNDAVALSQSDVGIAVGSAADLSLEVADVVLLSDNLHLLVVALDLSKTVYNRIKLNLGWAFTYNLLALPLAAGVLFPFGVSIPPTFAGLADLLSSIPIILFSLLLHRYKAPKCDLELQSVTEE